MIELIIPYINSRIETLKLFNKRFELCEIITKAEVSFPAEFCMGEYKQVSDFDKNQGTIYHRLIDNISSQEIEDESSIGCDPFIERIYPIRTVGAIKRIGKTAYEDSMIAEYIANAISFINNKSLRQQLKVDSIGVEVKNISTERNKIWVDEYKGIEMAMDYQYIYLAIDYNIKITGNVSCFSTDLCGVSIIRDFSDDYS